MKENLAFSVLRDFQAALNLLFLPQELKTCSASSHNCVSTFLVINPHLLSVPVSLFCGSMNPPVPVWFIPALSTTFSITWGSAREAEPAGDRNPHRHMWVYTPKEPISKKTEETSKQKGARQNREKATGSQEAPPVTSPHCLLVSSGIKSDQKALKLPLAPVIKTDKLSPALEKPAPPLSSLRLCSPHDIPVFISKKPKQKRRKRTSMDCAAWKRLPIYLQPGSSLSYLGF